MGPRRYRYALTSAMGIAVAGLMFAPPQALARARQSSVTSGLTSAIHEVVNVIEKSVKAHASPSQLRQLNEALIDLVHVLEDRRPRQKGHFSLGVGQVNKLGQDRTTIRLSQRTVSRQRFTVVNDRPSSQSRFAAGARYLAPAVDRDAKKKLNSKVAPHPAKAENAQREAVQASQAIAKQNAGPTRSKRGKVALGMKANRQGAAAERDERADRAVNRKGRVAAGAQSVCHAAGSHLANGRKGEQQAGMHPKQGKLANDSRMQNRGKASNKPGSLIGTKGPSKKNTANLGAFDKRTAAPAKRAQARHCPGTRVGANANNVTARRKSNFPVDAKNGRARPTSIHTVMFSMTKTGPVTNTLRKAGNNSNRLATTRNFPNNSFGARTAVNNGPRRNFMAVTAKTTTTNVGGGRRK